MQDTEAQEIINQIILQAQENAQTEFHQINTWAEYFFYVGQRKSLKAVLKILRACERTLFREYCKEIATGFADLEKLLAYKQFAGILTYYRNELSVIISMLDDFENYIIMGGLIRSILGIPREED